MASLRYSAGAWAGGKPCCNRIHLPGSNGWKCLALQTRKEVLYSMAMCQIALSKRLSTPSTE